MSRRGVYFFVRASRRGGGGPPANSDHATLGAWAGYKLSDRGRIFLNGGYFTESRHNGTVAQKNSTATGFGAIGLDTPIGSHDQISSRLFGQAQGYDQAFSSVKSIAPPPYTKPLPLSHPSP